MMRDACAHVGLVVVGAVLVLGACRSRAEAPSPAPSPLAAPKVATDAPSPDVAAPVDAALADVSGVLDAVVVIDAAIATDAGAVSHATRPTKRTLRHGEVCRSGDRSGAPAHDVGTCGKGLSCCYPCGIPGCAYVCHTDEECRADMMRP